MKKLIYLICLLPTFLFGGVSYQVHNRPLAKVGDRIITLVDLIKQMDAYLYTHNLQLGTEERIQFYKNSWHYVLDQFIDSELMLMVAKEREITVSEGDVREEMFRRYGSNMQTTLAELNISYFEAKEMVQQEMTVEQVQGYNIQAKAMQEVTPQEVKNAYFAYLLAHPPVKEWSYQVLSLTGEDSTLCANYADKAYHLIQDDKRSFTEVKELLKEEPGLSISISNDYTAEEKNLSASHKSILASLKEGEISFPEKQISRTSGKNTYRIFLLKHYENKGAPPFNAMAEKLKSALLQAKAAEEAKLFTAKLREKYHYTPINIPADYEPFTLTSS
ncbi:MAG: SurA N-terminal domain-containing protein [Simkaniaceae bacterium]|nr:SurA N-terminal domain-containing protein [Simkaniaceae bacterium]